MLLLIVLLVLICLLLKPQMEGFDPVDQENELLMEYTYYQDDLFYLYRAKIYRNGLVQMEHYGDKKEFILSDDAMKRLTDEIIRLDLINMYVLEKDMYPCCERGGSELVVYLDGKMNRLRQTSRWNTYHPELTKFLVEINKLLRIDGGIAFLPRRDRPMPYRYDVIFM